MIEFKTAVKTAIEFLAEAYPNENLRDLRLEEIELSANEEFWYITVSYAGDASSLSGLARAIAGPPDREYKVIAVRSEDGRVQSMKIRQLV